jgi:arylsulfatase A-like enzyme
MRSVLSLSVAALFLSAAAARAADAPAKPNVLFVAVDDLRPALGCAGDPHAKTPAVDALAARGTVFTRAYCQQAVCSPSRSSLLTGRRPDSTKVYDLVTHFRKALPDVVTLPQHFKSNGYYAHGVGKIYHGGYDDPPSWSVPWEGTKGKGFGPDGLKLLDDLKAKAKAAGDDVSRVRGLPVEAPDVPDGDLNDGWTANRAIEILKVRKGQKEPFFLAVGFLKPHLPFVAPKKYWDLYDPAKLPAAGPAAPPKDAPAFAPQFGGELRAYHGIPKSGPVPDETARKLVHGYYAATSYMDAQLGRVLAALKENGFADNTVVILWGDHGWHLGDHGMWCKHTNYEKATRAALVMSRPGQKATGKPSAALVEFVDIYPTLAEVCGLPKPDGVEGYSFAPLLDDPAKPWKAAAFSQYPRGGGKDKDVGPLMGYAVKTDRYRYVEWRKRGGTEVVARELYDHTADPGEDRNVAADPANKAVVEEHAKRLAAGWKGNAPPK